MSLVELEAIGFYSFYLKVSRRCVYGHTLHEIVAFFMTQVDKLLRHR